MSIQYLKKTYTNLKAACGKFEDKRGLLGLATEGIPSKINKQVALKVDAFLKKNPKKYPDVQACISATSAFCSALDKNRLSFLKEWKNAEPEKKDEIEQSYIESVEKIANLYAAKKN